MTQSRKSCLASFCMQLSCKSRLAKLCLKLLRETVVQKVCCEAIPQPRAWSCLAKPAFQNYCPSFCMTSSCKGCLSKLFREFFHGTVVRKVSRKAIFENLIWNCRAKELSGRGLGRSLSHVGRSQISLSVMLRAALVHKLPCEAIS